MNYCVFLISMMKYVMLEKQQELVHVNYGYKFEDLYVIACKTLSYHILFHSL